LKHLTFFSSPFVKNVWLFLKNRQHFCWTTTFFRRKDESREPTGPASESQKETSFLEGRSLQVVRVETPFVSNVTFWVNYQSNLLMKRKGERMRKCLKLNQGPFVPFDLKTSGILEKYF
jgi:hypothetical protein